MKPILTAIFTPLLLLIAFTTSASAATVVPMNLTELVERSDHIVIAEVTETHGQLESTHVYTTIRLDIEETLKGDTTGILEFRQLGGRDFDADLATSVPGMPVFLPDQKVLLFLSEPQQDTYFVTGMSQGIFEIVLAPDNLTEVAVPRLHGLHFRETVSSDFTALPRSHEQLFGGPHLLTTLRSLILAITSATHSGEDLQ